MAVRSRLRLQLSRRGHLRSVDARTAVPPVFSSCPTTGCRPAAAAASASAGACRLAGLDQQDASGREPARRDRDHPPGHVEPVGAAVQGDPRLVVAGLRRHQADRVGRHVRGVGDEHIHPCPSRRAAVVEVARRTRAGAGRLRRRTDRDRVDIDGVQLGTSSRAASTAAATAPEPQHRSTTTARGGASRAASRPAARSAAGARRRRLHGDPQPAELDPAEDVLQRTPATRRSPGSSSAGV